MVRDPSATDTNVGASMWIDHKGSFTLVRKQNEHESERILSDLKVNPTTICSLQTANKVAER